MVRVLITDGMEKESVQKLKDLGASVTEQFFEPEALMEQVKNYDVLVVRSATKVRADLIDRMVGDEGVKLIIRGGVGVDNIDVVYATEKGIEVCNTPNASSNTVAEYVIAQILSLARHLHEANVTMHQGQWNKKAYQGIEVAGKTLGIIGFGRIGKALAAKASALGMKICYYDLMDVDSGNSSYQKMDFEELLKNSDFISIHISGDEGTLIGEDEFNKMKKGVYIINTARGKVVDADALVKAIDEGIVAGAALDVFEKEPLADANLMESQSISLTPHIGGSTREAQAQIGDEVVEIIREFMERGATE